MHVTHELIWNGLLKLKQKGVDMRVITQITSDNLTYVAEKTFIEESVKTTKFSEEARVFIKEAVTEGRIREVRKGFYG